MKKTVIERFPVSLDEPYSNLDPIIEFLKAGGNSPKNGRFINKPHSNSVYVFESPLDFDALVEHFEFPDSIVLTRQTNSILDSLNMNEIVGGVG